MAAPAVAASSSLWAIHSTSASPTRAPRPAMRGAGQQAALSSRRPASVSAMTSVAAEAQVGALRPGTRRAACGPGRPTRASRHTRRSSWSSSALRACRTPAGPSLARLRPARAGGRAGPRASPRTRGRCFRAQERLGTWVSATKRLRDSIPASSRCGEHAQRDQHQGGQRRPGGGCVERWSWPSLRRPPRKARQSSRGVRANGYSPPATFFCITSR